MRKLLVAAFVSLDGVMQAPGGPDEDKSDGFQFGGWIVPYSNQIIGQAVVELFSQPFSLLLGRKTYDIFANYWPKVPEGHSIGDPFNSATKYVATRNGSFSAGWQNSRIIGPDAAQAVKTLKQQDGPTLVTQGSSVLLQSLFAHRLVDEIQTMTMPVILGRGKRLFSPDASPTGLKLLHSQTSPTGVVIARYAVVGEVPTGSF